MDPGTPFSTKSSSLQKTEEIPLKGIKCLMEIKFEKDGRLSMTVTSKNNFLDTSNTIKDMTTFDECRLVLLNESINLGAKSSG